MDGLRYGWLGEWILGTMKGLLCVWIVSCMDGWVYELLGVWIVGCDVVVWCYGRFAIGVWIV